VLEFFKINSQGEDDSTLAKDAYEVLGITEEATQSEVKKAYRKMSVSHHPDKGGDPKLFEQIRMAYEILQSDDNRSYYDLGGPLLVKNIETAFKEYEGQEAQAMAQLDQQVPKNHPMRAQAEAQIKAQIKSKEQIKPEILQKMRNDDIEVEVEVELEDIFQGVADKEITFDRLEICRGCRDCRTFDPEDASVEEKRKEKCTYCSKQCGKCPPEIRQLPKMQGPFMVGTKEVEVESAEKCRSSPTKQKVRVPAAASDGTFLKKIRNKGHQTPGKIPGDVKLVVRRKKHSEFAIVEDQNNDLFTVMSISVRE